jgi:hypothetical protein
MPMFKEAAQYAAHQMKKHAGDILKNPVKGIYNTTKGMVDSVLDPYAEFAADATIKGAKLTGKVMTKKVNPSMMNLYTGRDLSKTAAFSLPVAGAAIGVGGYMVSTAGPKPGTVSYGSEAPVFAADGVANTNAPTLNASGNMVFGLHNARKG